MALGILIDLKRTLGAIHVELAEDFPCVGAAARQAAVSASLMCTAGTGAARSPLPHRAHCAARCWCRSPALSTPTSPPLRGADCSWPSATGSASHRGNYTSAPSSPTARASSTQGCRTGPAPGQQHARCHVESCTRQEQSEPWVSARQHRSVGRLRGYQSCPTLLAWPTSPQPLLLAPWAARGAGSRQPLPQRGWPQAEHRSITPGSSHIAEICLQPRGRLSNSSTST